MMRAMWPTVVLLFAIASAGCKTTATPCWLHPGDTETQQKQALRYDPYPEPDTGPPVDGARPREYEVPPADPSRARWVWSTENADRWWKPQPAVAPPAAAPPPATCPPAMAPPATAPPATAPPANTPSQPQG